MCTSILSLYPDDESLRDDRNTDNNSLMYKLIFLQYNGHGTKHPSPSLINIARNEVIALEETDGSEVGGSAEATVPQRLKYDVENHVLKWMVSNSK